MFSSGDKIPAYLLGKYQTMATVVIAALFSLFLLLISLPFSQNPWFKIETPKALGYAVVFYLIAIFIISVSKRAIYHLYKTRQEMSYLLFIIWDLAEIILIALLYTIFTIRADENGLIDIGTMGKVMIYFDAMSYCLMSLGVPYIISAMYFAIIDKNNTIRVMNYSTVISDEVLLPKDEKKITLFDNSGVLKLSVSSTNLYFIESDDNYIKVWYTDSQGVLKQYMLRCRLKTVEESFSGSGLIRCHRKYIVNMDKVKVLRREKDGYEMELDNDSIKPIPVTKTYEENILTRFNSGHREE